MGNIIERVITHTVNYYSCQINDVFSRIGYRDS